MMQRSTRNELRARILAERDALSSIERKKRSKAISQNLWQLEAFTGASYLFCYVNFRSEVETMPLIRQALVHGKQGAVPLTVVKEKRLIPYVIFDPEKDLQPGYCGIPEPQAPTLQIVDPQKIEVVIVPGSVFDKKGGRLGYGGGYYDRFLANQAPQALRIGIAFDMQVVTELSLLPHDQQMDYLVTEKEVIAIKRRTETIWTR